MSTEAAPPPGPRKVCVIGWPVEHSRSPLIHTTWLRRKGLAADYAYTRMAVPPDELADTVRHLVPLGFRGANVTVPHKEAACAALAPFVDPPAERLRAVNTIYRDPDTGDLRGTNTDGIGFLTNLERSVPGFPGRVATVLGAGGAARAIADVLEREAGMEVRLVNRTVARAADMVADLGLEAAVYGWEHAGAALTGADLLVNATSLGMTGQPPLDVPLAALPRDAVVCDIVYVPLETPLLATARAAGHRTVDGLGMLLRQAVPGFERWFGVTLDEDEVAAARAAVLADLRQD
mgnify:CR=1 FL=1